MLQRFSIIRRITNIQKAKADGTFKSKDERTIESAKTAPIKSLSDFDTWENSRSKLRFRTFPWMHWILGFMWILGLVYVIYSHYRELINLKKNKVWTFSLFVFAFAMGIAFLYTGKVRSVIFDKASGTVTIKKRNTCCDRRSIVTY